MKNVEITHRGSIFILMVVIIASSAALIALVSAQNCCPHVSIDAPSSVKVGDIFTVALHYTHDAQSLGGVHLHWNSTEAEFRDANGCSNLTEANAPGVTRYFSGNLVVEKVGTWMNSGDVCKVVMVAKRTGNLKLFYRAWDNSNDAECGNGRIDHDRDPNKGTCSANCDQFPNDLIACDTYNKTIAVSAAQCSDSDGGKNYLFKGTCGASTDFCSSSDYIKEYLCLENGLCGAELDSCSSVFGPHFVCRNGACVGDTSVCTLDTVSINQELYYGVYKIYITNGDATYVRIKINKTDATGKDITVDNLLIDGWSYGKNISKNSNAAELTVTLSNIAALQNGQFIVAELGVGPFGKSCVHDVCGNDNCELGENSVNCPEDCPATTSSSTSSTTTTRSTSTTTTTALTSTTITSRTTSTIIPYFAIKCSACFVNETCHCNITSSSGCDTGYWKLTNKQNNPLNTSPTYIDILSGSPTKIEFRPQETGKVNVTADCRASGPNIMVNNTNVSVVERFISCPTNCSVNEECKCTVIGCKKGTFRVFEDEGSPLEGGSVRLDIADTIFVGKFTPYAKGKVDVFVKCEDPSREEDAYIKILQNETDVKKDFSVSLFNCKQKSSGDYRCSIDFTNNMDEDAVVIFFFTDNTGFGTGYDEGDATKGSGSVSGDFECNTPGEYTASWTVFKQSDDKFVEPLKISKTFKSFDCD